MYAHGFASSFLLKLNHLKFNNKKSYFDIAQNSTDLIETEGQSLCYNEPLDKLDEGNPNICLPLSLFLACFRLGPYNEIGGHIRATKTYANAKRFWYWRGMFDWICALTADCINCQIKKPKPKQRNEVLLKEWQNDKIPFRTVHIDHKGPLHPPSNRNLHCLLVIDALPRFLIVYPFTNTSAQTTIAAVGKWIRSFGIPQSIIHNRGTAFINSDFINLTKEFGNLFATTNSLLPMDKWQSRDAKPTNHSVLAKFSV